MKIALINENSQASKNPIIFDALTKATEKLGHECINIGMFGPDDDNLTYVQCGILAAVLLNSKAVDYVVTGCGTGEGAMLSCNSFPGVLCGHIEDPVDAYTFAQVNDGNCVSLPYAKGFGWGGELNLLYTFDKLFSEGSGKGYPRDRVVFEQANKKILDKVKLSTYKTMPEILENLDKDLLKGALNRKSFTDLFFSSCQDSKLLEAVKKVLE